MPLGYFFILYLESISSSLCMRCAHVHKILITFWMSILLESVEVSLSLLEELQNSGSGENTDSYTPSIVSVKQSQRAP